MTDALVNGKAIGISRGEYINRGECKVEFLCSGCKYRWELQCNTEHPASCPKCGSKSFIESEDDGRKKRYIENDYCYPKSEGKTAAVNVKAGSVKMTKIAIP